jgi:threonine dehydrogenase-like Zn-dependent dehydrogenase
MAEALVTEGRGTLALEHRPPLEPGPDELVVAPQVVGVCGTDLELIDGVIDAAYVNYPLVIGHEWAGTVTASRSSQAAVGDRVVVEGIIPCWHCEHCVAGETNLCDTYQEIGFTRDGAGAGEVVVPARLAHRLPAAATLEDGSLVEPASVVYHGLSRVLTRPGLHCLVVGDGTIGLLALQLLSLWSPARLVLSGRRAEQAALARACGAGEVVEQAPERSFDLVVEAAGTTESFLAALGAVRRGGTLLVLGLPPHGALAPVPVDDLVNNDLLLRASFGYTSSAWTRVVALLGSGRFHPGAIVTHRLPLGSYEEAVGLLRSPRPGEARGKVVLWPNGAPATP